MSVCEKVLNVCSESIIQNRTNSVTNELSFVNLDGVSEIKGVRWEKDYMVVGAGTTIQQLSDALHEKMQELDPSQQDSLRAFRDQCRFLGNWQVRSVATVGGGLMNFSTYSDMVPMWVASGAEAIFAAADGTTTSTCLADSFGDGHELLWRPEGHGALVALRVPLMGKEDFFTSFKYSRRRLDSITFLSAGMRVRFLALNCSHHCLLVQPFQESNQLFLFHFT